MTTSPSSLSLLDLGIGLVVVLTVLLGLRRGRGVLAALASGVLVAVGCWLACAVGLAVGPTSWHQPLATSGFVHLTDPPVDAVQTLVGRH